MESSVELEIVSQRPEDDSRPLDLPQDACSPMVREEKTGDGFELQYLGFVMNKIRKMRLLATICPENFSFDT